MGSGVAEQSTFPAAHRPSAVPSTPQIATTVTGYDAQHRVAHPPQVRQNV